MAYGIADVPDNLLNYIPSTYNKWVITSNLLELEISWTANILSVILNNSDIGEYSFALCQM